MSQTAADTPPTPTRREALARWISIVGHPFVLILLYVLVSAATRLPLSKALVAMALVFVGGVLPMVLYLGRLAGSGETNFDVSHREKRGPVYGLGLALGVGLVITFRTFEAPTDLLAGMICCLVMVVVASVINFKLKVSLHSAFALWVAVGFWKISPWASVVLLGLASAVVWSRLHLDRHTRGEVVAGILLGAVMAVPMLLFF